MLGEIGAILVHAEMPNITVRLPSSLVRAALEAWERDDGEGPPDPESFEQHVMRSRAATLALIGRAVEESGRADGEEVVVELSPNLVGNALEAADDLPR
ncbi:MAG TPA: hypothetical protein VKR79_09470 [Gaiellaceae bacterium]|nr:hypothetical protein [Gaiellaceae bacterium]